MWMTLLLLSHAAAEWVEINQQHYLKPVKVIPNPAFINAPSTESQETSISSEIPDDKADKTSVKLNRIYINHTALNQGWDDEIFTDSNIPESSTTKLTRKFRPHTSENNKNSREQNTLVGDKITDKSVKVNEIVRITDKRLVNKNPKEKTTVSTKNPNRIYIEDEHSGSLEVYELSELEKLAEKDSEEYYTKHMVLKQTVPANLAENEASAQTIKERYKIGGNKMRNKTKEPYRLLNTNNLRRVDIIKNSDSQHVTKGTETESVPDKSVAFIKKHMVAKITKVDIPNKIKTSAEKTITTAQKDKHQGTQFDQNLQDVIKLTKSEFSDNVSITTKNPSEVKVNNRYEHRGTKKADKAPDPEVIMIKEILSENEKVKSTSTEIDDIDDSGKKVVGDPEYKKHAKTKGQKVPDPDAAMIQELLSEVADMSHENPTTKEHQVNNKVVAVQTVHNISTRKPPNKFTLSTQIPTKKNKSPIAKETVKIQNQVNSQEYDSLQNKPVPVQLKEYQTIEKPATIYDDYQPSSVTEEHHTTHTNINNFVLDRKTDKIGKIKISDPKDNYDVEFNLNTVKNLQTTDTLTTEKGIKHFDSEQYSHKPVKIHASSDKGGIEFDSREHPSKSIEIHTSTEKGVIEFEEYSFKPVIRLHEEKPEFVSKEEFFTESGVELNENYSESDLEISTVEPVIPTTDNILDFTRAANDDLTAAKNKEEVEHKTTDRMKDEININEKKDSTMENVIKLLKVVTDIIARNTRKSFSSKVKYLEGLKDTLLANIEERIEATFPGPPRDARSAWSGAPRAAAAGGRGHVDFPSSESSLMTISFLTFAVFLIKLVLQVIHTYKSKTAVPSVVAAVGRAAGRWQHGRN